MCYMVSPDKINHADAVVFCMASDSSLARMMGRNILFLQGLSTPEGMWIASPPNYECYSMTPTHAVAADCLTELQSICWKQTSQP